MNTQSQVSRSADLFARAQRVLPGGVSRNTVLRSPHPAYAAFGEGCRITDLDGITRIDFSNNMASLIHGHADPGTVEAVAAQLARGSAFMMATEVEVDYAEHLCSRNDGFDMLRFMNSGTEAIMVALKASRAFTGRPKIAKIEGAYHGTYDFAEVSQTSKPETWGSPDAPARVPVVHGTPQSTLDDVVVIPFNDVDRAIAILEDNAADLACVLLDLMPHRAGLNPADPEFVHAIRDWTSKHGALLALDEVITFRTEYGGLQQRYGITADLTAMGKAIGGGFPIGAVAGRADVMDLLNPRSHRYLFPHSGTFSANPISTTAGLSAMTRFDAEAITRLNALTQRAVDGIRNAIADSGATACVTGCGSMFRFHLKQNPPHNFREAYLDPTEQARLNALLDHLFEEGFIMINTCSATLSTPMTEADIDALVAAFASGLPKIV